MIHIVLLLMNNIVLQFDYQGVLGLLTAFMWVATNVQANCSTCTRGKNHPHEFPLRLSAYQGSLFNVCLLGSRKNDKHIVQTNKAIANLLVSQDWLGCTSWEVVNNANGDKKAFH